MKLLIKLVPRQDAISLPILGTRGSDNVGRKLRARRGFWPANSLEVITHKLFVERRLGAAGIVLSGGPEAGGVWSERFINPDQGVDCFRRVEGAVEKAELELGVGEENAAGRGVRRGAAVEFDADGADAFGERIADEGGGPVKGNIFVVPASGLGGRSEDGRGQAIGFAQARRESNAADFSSGFIVFPAGAGNIAADNTFDGKRLRLAHNHGAVREIVAIGVEWDGEVRGA